MLWEERMEAAERYRQEGNALFTAGDARGAAVKYLLVRQSTFRREFPLSL